LKRSFVARFLFNYTPAGTPALPAMANR